MKKFFAAMIMVCLSVAFSNAAMAQGPHRDNGRPGPAPASVHQPAPAPAHHVNAVPAPRHAKPVPPPAPRHAKPVPPPAPRHAKPVPPPAPRHAKPVPPPPPAPHHAKPVPPPPPVPRPVIDYRPGVGLYIGGEHFGFTISL